MASISMAMPITTASNRKLANSDGAVRISKAAVVLNEPKPKCQLNIQAFMKEKTVAGMAAAALTASMVVPEVAQAANSDFSPSLQNFFLSIAAGGVVLAAILGAVIGVANFDPVKRS